MHLDPDAVQLEVGHGRAAGLAATATSGSGARPPASAGSAVPTCRPTRSSASSPPAISSRGGRGGRRQQHRRPPDGRQGTPYASARPSCTRASSAPCRSSPKTRPRSRPCSASVARANSAPPRWLGRRRTRAGQIGHLREGRVDLDHGQRRCPTPAAAVPAATSSPARSGAAAGCRRGRRRRSRCRRASPSASTAAIKSRLAFRERVALSAAQASANRDSSTPHAIADRDVQDLSRRWHRPVQLHSAQERSHAAPAAATMWPPMLVRH